MPVRSANAVWEGGLKDGAGHLALGSGAFEGRYSFGSRFEEAGGTNPEELIGAAHAGCFSMALSAALGRAGYAPKRIATAAKVHLEKVGDAFRITRIDLTTEAEIPGIDDAAGCLREQHDQPQQHPQQPQPQSTNSQYNTSYDNTPSS